MKRYLIPVLGLLTFVPCGFAIIDLNQNGLSDLWERQHNNGSLFGASFEPQGDDDGDGWSNSKEAVSGTDPLDGTPPSGWLLPQVGYHPSVWVDTDNDGIVDSQTVEMSEITWPSFIGKEYQLSSSPDLSSGTWLEVDGPRMGTGGVIGLSIPLTQPDGSIPERLFWRVAVRDLDTDADGLNNHEEHLLGTNPALPMTYPGIPDAWLATHFPTAQSFDPYGDPDGDGLDNQQENELGLDPNSAEAIGPVNFGFDEEISDSPTLSFRPENPADLYEDGSVSGWEPDIGSHIEIWDEDDGNPYAELQSHLEAHGVKQKFDMIPGTRLDFILRYKGRYEFYAPYENAFDLKVEGASTMLVNGSPATASGGGFRQAFMEDDDGENYAEWHYVAVSITAETGGSGLKEITLTLAPQTTTVNSGDGDEEITRGGFVDFLRVKIEDNLFATGVDDVSIRSKAGDKGHQDKFWIMAPSGNDPNGNPCSNEMKFKSLDKALEELEITYQQGAQAPATPTPDTVLLGSPPDAIQLSGDGICAWHGESPTITEDPAVIWKIGAPAQTKTEVKLPIAVKTMKRRTVRVAVWPVNLPNAEGIFPNLDERNAFEAGLKAELDQIFAYQINAWFEISVGGNKTFDYLDGTSSGTSPDPY